MSLGSRSNVGVLGLHSCQVEPACCTGMHTQQQHPSASHLATSGHARSYYEHQRRKQGSFFCWLGLSREQARERGFDMAAMQLELDPGAGRDTEQLLPRGVVLQ